MSGIESSKATKEGNPHVCTSCMNAVVQTFSYFQEQITTLRSEKADLEEEIKKLTKVGEEQTRVKKEEIKALEEELAKLKKQSE